MEAFVKQLLASLTPYLLQYLMDNRSVLIDFLRTESKKTDNKIDDFVVEILADYINGL
jgi:hypothetical protein